MHKELKLSQDKINYINYVEDELAKGKYEKMLSYFGDLDGKTILDVGCGPGILIDVLLKQSPKLIVALDIDTEWLNYTNKKYGNNKNVIVIRANAEHLPFKYAYFDLISCKVVLPYVPDETMAINGMCACLARGGVIFLGLHCMWYYIYLIFRRKDMSKLYATLSLLSGVIHQIIGKKMIVSPDTYQTPSKLKKALEKQDMRIIKIYKFDRWFWGYNLFDVVAKKR